MWQDVNHLFILSVILFRVYSLSLLVTLLNTGNACESFHFPVISFPSFCLHIYLHLQSCVQSACFNVTSIPILPLFVISPPSKIDYNFRSWCKLSTGLQCVRREVIFWDRINLCPRHSTNFPWNRQQLRNINLNLKRKSTKPVRKQLSSSAFQRFRAKWMLHRYLWITSELQIDIPASWACPTQDLSPSSKIASLLGHGKWNWALTCA